MKAALILLALLNAGWMIFDGVHVLRHGKYFGPEKAGPWTFFPKLFGFDPFRFGPVFIVLGCSWVITNILFLLNVNHAYYITMIPAVLTLWYIPVGSAISVLYLVLLLLGN